MTATLLQFLGFGDWLTIGLWAFLFVTAIVIAFSYRYFRRDPKPRPPTPMQLARMAYERRRECNAEMREHRYRVSRDFVMPPH